MTPDEIAAAKVNGKSGEANTPRLFDALAAGQDVIALGKAAKLIAAMSPNGRRAALCWLIGYFDAPGYDDALEGLDGAADARPLADTR